MNVTLFNKKNLIFSGITSILLLLSFYHGAAAGNNRTVHQVWVEQIQDQEVVFYREKSGGSWSNPTQISALPGQNVSPVVLSDGHGAVWIVWTNIQGDEGVLIYTVKENGHWSDPKKIDTGLKNNFAPCLAADDRHGLWLFFSGNDGHDDDDIFGMRWLNGNWAGLFQVNETNATPDILPFAGINADGRLEVAWAGIKTGKYEAQSAVFAGTNWVRGSGLIQNKTGYTDMAPSMDNAVSTYSQNGGIQSLSLKILQSLDTPDNELQTGVEDGSLAGSPDPHANLLAQEYIITFGDSITWDSGGHAYRKELMRLLNEDGRDVQFYDWGKFGETTVEGLIRLDRYIGLVEADYLLLLEGTNDIRFGISYETTIANLELMLEKTLAAEIVPLISNLTPDGTSSDYNRRIVNTYNPGIEALAEKKDVIFVDNYTPLVQNWSDYSDDGLHPNEAGYRVMARTWYDALPEPEKPLEVQTSDAIDISDNSATLTALITPNGTLTRYSFEYGIDRDELTQVTEELLLEGDAPQTLVKITIHDLLPQIVYYYRAKAVDDDEEVRGEISSFTTGEEGSGGGDDGGGSSGGCFIETLYR